MSKLEGTAWVPDLTLDNIHAGDTFFTFRDLCNAMGLDSSKRYKKDSILRELHRFVDYSVVGRGFVVNRIRTVPLHKKAPRQYQELIQVLLHAHLASQPKLMVETTYKKLYSDISIAGENYTKIYNKETYEKFRDEVAPVSYEIFEEFRRRAGKGLKQKVDSALDYMARQQLVLWDKNLWICHDRVYQGGVDEGESRYIHLPATDNEKAIYINARRYILTELFQCDTIDEIYIKHKSRQYHEAVNNYILNMYGWNYAYDKLRIWYNYDDMRVSLEDARIALLEEARMNDIEVKKDVLNQKIMDMLNQSAESSHKSAIKKLGSGFIMPWGELPPDVQKYGTFAEDSALIAWKVMTGYFISKNADVSALSAFYPSSEYDKIDDDLDFGV